MRSCGLQSVGCVVVVIVGFTGLADEPGKSKPEVAPPVTLVGLSIPVAPRQADAWVAPSTKLPDKLISATQFLFDHGMADPRGCEYRSISVVVGSVWGGHHAVKTNGWVLPERPNQSARFAICWNGLIYPIREVGPVARLADDVTKEATQNDFSRTAIREETAVSHESRLHLRCLLLLRLGEVELAEQFWRPVSSEEQADVNKPSDPFLVLAHQWLWTNFDRAICAHMRSDHRVALASAEALVKHHKDFDKEAERRGFQRPESYDRQAQRPSPYFGFLGDVDRLFADQQRRVKQEEVVRVLGPNSPPIADKEQRIANLIRDLEEVAARQWGQPGGVSLTEDPIIQALVKEGTAAIEPLVKCVESDNRLTRSVSFHRDFFTNRNLIGTSNAAYSALCQIMEVKSFGPKTLQVYGIDRLSMKERQEITDEIRQYWKTRGQVSLEQGWFITLQDDKATSLQWVEAAGRLTMPADVRIEGMWTTIPGRPDGKVPPMRGESLRDRANPSVTDLLIKRSNQVMQSKGSSSNSVSEVEKASQIAQSLALWDRANATPVLRSRIRDCIEETTKKLPNQGSSAWVLNQRIISMTSSCLRAGDTEAVTDYCRWVRQAPPDEMVISARNAYLNFEPLWLRPDLECCRETAAFLFTDPQSKWNPIHNASQRGFGRLHTFSVTPLLSLGAFRQQLAKNLDDKSIAGSVTVSEKMVTVKRGTGTSKRLIFNPHDPLLPKPNEALDVRQCDLYATELAALDGVPGYELYWPLDVRDQALVRIKVFVEQWGPRYGTVAPRDHQRRRAFDWDTPFAQFTLPPLKQPASDDDVKQGLAIFSLGTANPVRQVTLTPFPQRARLKTQKQPPASETKPNGTAGDQTTPSDEGVIWQAEEVQQDGQWIRYYGFVGRHVIARFPTTEIEVIQEEGPKQP